LFKEKNKKKFQKKFSEKKIFRNKIFPKKNFPKKQFFQIFFQNFVFVKKTPDEGDSKNVRQNIFQYRTVVKIAFKIFILKLAFDSRPQLLKNFFAFFLAELDKALFLRVVSTNGTNFCFAFPTLMYSEKCFFYIFPDNKLC
jgi:hypothetical protein